MLPYFSTKIPKSSPYGQATISGQIIMAQEWLFGTKYGSLYERKDQKCFKKFLHPLARNVVEKIFLRRLQRVWQLGLLT